MLSLGQPIPQNSQHSISVSLPTWNDVIGYEEKNPLVCNALKTGYPRFVIHDFVKSLCEKYKLSFIFPSYKSALLASEFSQIPESQIVVINQNLAGIYSNKREELNKLKQFWQHTGHIISSRQALYYLNQETIHESLIQDGQIAENKIKHKISALTQQDINNIYLFPNGMSALFLAYKVSQASKPQAKTLQFGFPYTDTFKIQEKFGSGTILCLNNHDLDKLNNQDLSAIFCEFPSNPLLESPDLSILSKLAQNKNCPLIIDDTIGTYYNLDLFAGEESADFVVTSLSKFFSGVGDVMGGALILNPRSNNYKKLKSSLDNLFDNICWAEDLIVLEKNSRDFESRIPQINKNTEILCDYLSQKDQIEKIYYPKYSTDNNYKNKMKNIKNLAGFGGLFSLVLKIKVKHLNFIII